MNLLRNAREATGHGGRVEVALARREDGSASIRVHDDGPGVPAVVRARLFEPFVTTKPRGTGLGLALVHGLVTRMGGRIDAAPSAW